MTLLVSVPVESPTGTFKNFPYTKLGYEICESHEINFSQSENKFIVLIISDIHWTVQVVYDYPLKTGVLR